MGGTIHPIPLPTGVVFPYVGTTAPVGFVLLQGGTIGNASSGGTVRANADTEELFTLLWNSMADSEAPVSTGRGGSASADFAANKTITLPDCRGRQVVGSGTGPSLTARTHGSQFGAEKHNLVPLHGHPVNDAGHSHTPTLNSAAIRNGADAGSGGNGLNASSVATTGGSEYSTSVESTGITVDDTGEEDGVDHVDPSIAVNYICAL